MRKSETRKKWRGGNRQRKVSAVTAAVLAALLLTGCGGSDEAGYSGTSSGATSNAMAPESAYDYGYGYDSYESERYDGETGELGAIAEEASNSSGALSERKLIRTVNMEVETKEQDYDMFLATLENEVRSLGGYIESMDSYNGSNYSYSRSSRSANLTLRIPKDKLDGFLNLVSDIANVVRRSDNVEDVTLTYVDLESHRNALRTEQERLLELLEKAESLEDILTIESRLSSLRYQLESMESQLRTMDNQVDYSTLYLYVAEVKELTPVVKQTVWERITGGFADSLEDIADGAVEIFIWVLVNLPYLVLLGIFIAVVIIIVRACRKKSGKHRPKKAAQREPVESGASQEGTTDK